tara:strand:- start:295 stop:570 length:276 start_codon:yes stop_codon:yes gene_type:complete
MSKENYEPFENIPASKSFSDRALEWSAMYLTLIKAGKLSEDDDISKLTNELLKEMIESYEGEKEVERLRKEYVIEKEDLKNYNITKPKKND